MHGLESPSPSVRRKGVDSPAEAQPHPRRELVEILIRVQRAQPRHGHASLPGDGKQTLTGLDHVAARPMGEAPLCPALLAASNGLQPKLGSWQEIKRIKAGIE